MFKMVGMDTVLRWILPKLVSGKGTGENNNTLYLPIVKTGSARKRLAWSPRCTLIYQISRQFSETDIITKI